MPAPAVWNFSCVRGTTPGFSVLLQQTDPDTSALEPADLTDLQLSVKAGSNTFIAKLSNPADAGIISATSEPGRYTIVFPADWTRAMKVTGDDGVVPNKYELELWNTPAYQMVYLIGDITATGGINADA